MIVMACATDISMSYAAKSSLPGLNFGGGWKKLRPCTVQEQAEEQDLSPKRMSLSLALYVPGDIRNCMSRFDFFALSERGLRTRNDDAYCSEQIGDYYVFAIADGLDGHPFGDIASTTAIDAIRDAVKNTPGSPPGTGWYPASGMLMQRSGLCRCSPRNIPPSRQNSLCAL